MSGSDRQAIPDFREWSRGPLGSLGVVGRPSRMFGSGRDALPNVRGVREALQDVRKWSGDPPECM